jgi:hypothetical protein
MNPAPTTAKRTIELERCSIFATPTIKPDAGESVNASDARGRLHAGDAAMRRTILLIPSLLSDLSESEPQVGHVDEP